MLGCRPGPAGAGRRVGRRCGPAASRNSTRTGLAWPGTDRDSHGPSGSTREPRVCSDAAALPGLAELGRAHREQAVGSVQVVSVKSHALVWTHASGRQQADVSLQSGGPERAGVFRAAFMSAAISASENRYGVTRRGPAGTSPGGGTCVAGSNAASQRAKPRTMLSRSAIHTKLVSQGWQAQARATSTVTPSMSRSALNRAKSASRRPWRASLKPTARRRARYCSTLTSRAVMAAPPATAEPIRTGRQGRPWRRWPWCAGDDGAAPGRSRSGSLRPQKFRPAVWRRRRGPTGELPALRHARRTTAPTEPAVKRPRGARSRVNTARPVSSRGPPSCNQAAIAWPTSGGIGSPQRDALRPEPAAHRHASRRRPG